MSHLWSCPSCGLFGWRRYRRARSAAQMAEQALIAYWRGLGDRSRAERRSQRLWEARRIPGSTPLPNDGDLRYALLGVAPNAPWLTFRLWHPGDPTPDAAATAGFDTIASAYRHLDHAIAGGENAPSGPQSA
jgi:hypothetical protein